MTILRALKSIDTPKSSGEHLDLPHSQEIRILRDLQHSMLREGQDVLDLSMINPDLAPPRILIDRLVEAVGKPSNHRYAVARGVRKLREGFAAKYRTSFEVELDPETQICACSGSKDALVQCLRILLQADEKILLPRPTYPAHLAAAMVVGAVVNTYDSDLEERELVAEIKSKLDSSGARVLLLNFPNNPTGRFLSQQGLSEVVQHARVRGVDVVNDFVYGEMSFTGEKPPSLLSTDKNSRGLLEIYSLSKSYSIPGWRVGALMGCPETISKVAHLKSLVDYGVFLPIQYAAGAVLLMLRDTEMQVASIYSRRAKIVVEAVKKIGWNVVAPMAGASVWIELPVIAPKHPVNEDRSQGGSFAEILLKNEQVLVLPGVAFGDEYDRHLRIALVAGEDQLRDLSSRMQRAWHQWQENGW